MTDGKVDIVILKPFSVLDMPQLTLQLFSKRLEESTYQESYQTSRATFIRESAGVVHLDGEPVEMPERIEIEVLPQAIHVIRPEE